MAQGLLKLTSPHHHPALPSAGTRTAAGVEGISRGHSHRASSGVHFVLTSRLGICLVANIITASVSSKLPEALWTQGPLGKQRLSPYSCLGPKLWAEMGPSTYISARWCRMGWVLRRSKRLSSLERGISPGDKGGRAGTEDAQSTLGGKNITHRMLNLCAWPHRH